MTIEELSQKLIQGLTSSEELACLALSNIARNDLKLHSIAEIEPNALFYARALDKELKEKGPRSPLHGIPVVVKDNISTANTMHTTAGSLALADLITREDATIVRKLREAGALIIGKANLSEFAYWMSTQGMPSGYSSRGGQVVSPYKEGFDPSGSSSGSAVATAARLVPYSIGTETDGSLTSPGRNNAVTVIKPTIGLVSRDGIIPISHVQDTAGPMCNCIADAAIVLSVLQGKDEKDPATLVTEDKDFTKALIEDIRGWRIGLVRFEDYSDEEFKTLSEVKEAFNVAGATLEEITLDISNLDEYDVLHDEFKADMNIFLSSVRGLTKMTCLSDVVAYNRAHPENCLKYGQDLLEKSDERSGKLIEKNYIEERLRLSSTARSLLEDTMKKHDLKCLVTLQPNNLCPVSGNPVVAIPANIIDESDPKPVSLQFMGKSFEEDVLIRAAYTIEKQLNLTNRPSWVREFGE